MEPRIISKERLLVAGLTGDGRDTGKMWKDFDEKQAANPFPQADQSGYEIRFYAGEKPVIPGGDVHVGFAVAENCQPEGFSVQALPATAYACFDVLVARGYDSRNQEMNRWLTDHADQYAQRQLDGRCYVLECYTEKFKGGNQPDSVVEIWIPLVKRMA